MLLLVEVQRGNVLARLAVGQAEDDLAAESSGPGQRLVQHGGPVCCADEQDVVVGRLQRADTERELGAVGADHARDEEAIERQVHQAAQLPDDEARVVDAVHQDQQHVQPKLAATEHPAHAAHHHSAALLSRAPHAKGVDLVDEDDASAPDLGSLASRANHQVDAQSVDAEEHSGEGPTVGDVDRHVERRCDRFGKHGLARPRRPDHENAALTLAASLREQSAVLDELEDALHLVDRGLLAANVLDAHPEVCVVRVDHRLADACVEIEGTEEQHEVGAEEEEQIDHLSEDLLEKGG